MIEEYNELPSSFGATDPGGLLSWKFANEAGKDLNTLDLYYLPLEQ